MRLPQYEKLRYVAAGTTAWLLLLSGALAAEPQSQSQAHLAPLTAEQVVQKSVAAMGGAAAWRRVAAMQFSGKMDAGQERPDGGAIATTKRISKAEMRARAIQQALGKGPPAEAPKVIRVPYTLLLARPNKTRLEIPFKDQTAIQVFDGQQGWKLRPFLGRHEVETFSPEELKAALGDQQLDGPLVDAESKGIRISSDGAETLNNVATYRLRLHYKDGTTRRLWIDGQSFLQAALEGAPRRWNGKQRPVITNFGDYRAEEGLMVPHLLETRVEGEAQSQRLFIERVSLNPRLAPDAFSKPK